MDSKNRKKVGRYELSKSLGKGGMGEVFLAFDPDCERNVALKCIREDLKEKKSIKERFLKEAKIASQLTHPSILPIYTIHQNDHESFYTMPYIEGETLRQILRKTKEAVKNGDNAHPIGNSIPALIRIFLHVCEAVAYAHSKGILHRDLKPENIIIGKYGEVLIFDWGIANYISKQPVKSSKAAGTVSYMAPERAFGKPSSIATEVYALGVILYQILTLELPFERGNFAAFKKMVSKEKLIDPLQLAPYREIPHEAVHIVKTCLSTKEEERFHNVDQLINQVTKLIEGKPEWSLMAKLQIEKKEDWEFQENILLAKHTAITRHVDFLEWVNLMVSKQIFPDNIRIEADIKIYPDGNGMGILFSIPEIPKRRSMEEGYCLWLGSKKQPTCQLYRSNLLVSENNEFTLKENAFYHVTIEKIKEHVNVSIDHKATLSYYSRLPLTGSHVGILSKDADFEIKNIHIYGSSQSASVSCLAVPDAFFARGDYDTALGEYRRIATSFPGRVEGREAIFRSGLSLIEKSKNSKEQHVLLEQALQEFEQLHHTSGAPLEYLGKSIVYDLLKDPEEEVKCLEFALRKFSKHPLLPILEEHIIYRMHSSSQSMRKSAYQMILLALCYFPKIFKNKDAKKLLDSLQKHWEVPYFFAEKDKSNTYIFIAILLAFWVKKLSLLLEMPKNLLKNKQVDISALENIAFSLLELGYMKEVKKYLNEYGSYIPSKELFLLAAEKKDDLFNSLFQHNLSALESKLVIYVAKELLLEGKKINKWLESLKDKCAKEDRIHYDELLCWAYLIDKEYEKAKELISLYDKKSLLHTAYGAFIYATESAEKAMIYFSQAEESLYPPTYMLPGHFLNGNIDEHSEWMEQAFYWEKKELFRRLTLFFRVVGNSKKEKYFKSRL